MGLSSAAKRCGKEDVFEGGVNEPRDGGGGIHDSPWLSQQALPWADWEEISQLEEITQLEEISQLEMTRGSGHLQAMSKVLCERDPA